ncbi:MAG: hypothetical protein KatS3mg090_0154 [Patescibacteria group bacterium]|nr:MAG: hypothetical protein KatS3mg090_0154 [Patescibacteria group bacterium]
MPNTEILPQEFVDRLAQTNYADLSKIITEIKVSGVPETVKDDKSNEQFEKVYQYDDQQGTATENKSFTNKSDDEKKQTLENINFLLSQIYTNKKERDLSAFYKTIIVLVRNLDSSTKPSYVLEDIVLFLKEVYVLKRKSKLKFLISADLGKINEDFFNLFKKSQFKNLSKDFLKIFSHIFLQDILGETPDFTGMYYLDYSANYMKGLQNMLEYLKNLKDEQDIDLVFSKEELVEILKEIDSNIVYNEIQKLISRFSTTWGANHALADEFFQNLLREASKEFSIKNLLEGQNPVIVEEKNHNGQVIGYRLDRRKLFKLTTKHIYRAIEIIHKNASEVFEKAPERAVVQQYIGILSEWVANHLGRVAEFVFDNDTEIKKFFNYISGDYPRELLNLAGTFHNVPIWANSDEALRQIVSLTKSIPASKLRLFYNDLFPVMDKARKIIPLYLRRKLFESDFKLPADLFVGKFSAEKLLYSMPDTENIKQELRDVVRKLAGGDYEDWEIEMAVTYGLAYGTMTLQDESIIATAKPRDDEKGVRTLTTQIRLEHNPDIQFMLSDFAPLDYMVVPTHFRKRKSPLLGLLFPTGISPDTYKEMLNKKRILYSKLTKSKLGRFFEKIFKPLGKIKPIGWLYNKFLKGFINYLIRPDRRWERFATFRDLLNMIDIPADYASRGGWVVQDHLKMVKDIIKNDPNRYSIFFDNGNFIPDSKWTAEQWEAFFAISVKELGTASLWWWFSEKDNERVEHSIRSIFSLDGFKIERLEKYLKGKIGKKHPLEELFKVKKDGVNQATSFFMAKEYARWAGKGRIFFEYLHRNPGDFVILLNQMVPQLLSDPEIFYDNSQLSNLSSQKRNEIQEKREDLIALWGESNYIILKNFYNWIQTKLVPIYGGDTKKAISEFSKDMNLVYVNAFERIKNSNPRSMHDIRITRDDFSVLDDSRKDKVIDAVFGRGGLFYVIPQDEFANIFDIGDANGFFIQMAYEWEKTKGGINPFSADMDTTNVVSKFGEAGENALTRLVNEQYEKYTKLVETLKGFAGVIKKYAVDGDISSVLDFHDKVKGFVKSAIDSATAKKINFHLAAMFIVFFLDNSNLRRPLGLLNDFLLKPIFRSFSLGNNVSMANKIMDQLGAPAKMKSMDILDLNRYIEGLGIRGLLDYYGDYSLDSLREMFDLTYMQKNVHMGVTIAQLGLVAYPIAYGVMEFFKPFLGQQK